MPTTSAFSTALREAQLQPRTELVAALDIAWQQLAEPGAWLTGVQRIAIANTARGAWHCHGCDVRKAALSPSAPAPEHTGDDDIEETWIYVIHPVIRDSGRLTARVVEDAVANGLSEDEFVEIVSVTVLTRTMDAFALGSGVAQLPLPDPVAGTPARLREPTATPGPGWVSTIAPENAGPEFADFYANESHFYIRRALTLLPLEARRFWALLNTLYLEDPRINELDGVERALTRAQIEFLAARASALLGCYY